MINNQHLKTWIEVNNFRTRLTRLVILILLLITIFISPLISSNSFVHQFMIWVGYFLIILFVLGRIFCSAFISGKKGNTLVKEGPYGIIRNPLYFFTFLGVLGLALESGIISYVILTMILYCILYSKVVTTEENFLSKKFGQSYLEYVDQVPKWFSFTIKKSLPETWEFIPRMLLKTSIEASLFLIALPFFKLLEFLHGNGFLPVYLRLF